MTGIRHLMMQHRDIQSAEDVRRMAELGYFDTEFTMYGCAYLENGKMYYKVSEEPNDIYHFIDSAMIRGVWPSDVMKYTEKYSIPSGMKNLIEYDVKKNLAKKLKDTYPRELFELLNDIAAQIQPNHNAVDYLWDYIERIEGLFDEKKLHNFEILLDFMILHRKISLDHYNEIRKWLFEEQKNMENHCSEKDIFSKTIYGLCYENNGQLFYENNAQYSSIYELSIELIKKGTIVSPIFFHTYGYNYTFRLPDVIKTFKKDLRETYDTEIMQQINFWWQSNMGIDVDSFTQKAEYLKDKYGQLVFETFNMYGYLWGTLVT